MSHPEHIQDLIDDFAFLDDWEDRYMHVIELGKALPPLSAQERNDLTKVKGCVSQVWLVKSDNDDGTLSYRGDSDAHIVKGLVAVTLVLYSGQTPQSASFNTVRPDRRAQPSAFSICSSPIRCAAPCWPV